MALKVGGSVHSIPTSVGTVDYLPYLHGGIPSNYIFDGDVKAALFFGTAAASASVITSPGYFMLGMTDGTNQAQLNVASADGTATTNWRAILRNNIAAGFAEVTAGNTLCSATASIIQNGARLNWTQVNSAGYRVDGLVFGGSGIEAQVVTSSFVGGGAETKTVSHSLSGAPDIVIAMISTAAFNTWRGQGRSSYGFYARAANTYAGIAQTRLDGQTTEDLSQILSTTWIAAQINNAGTVEYAVTLGNFTATTFDAVTNANASTNGIAFLLLKIPNVNAKTGVIDLPTDTAEFAAVSGMTKRPNILIALPSLLTAANAASVSDNADCFGFGATYENNAYAEQFSGVLLTDDGQAGTKNSKSMTSGLLCQVPTLSGTPVTQMLALASSFRNDGINLSMGTPDTVIRKLGYLAFGDVTPQVVLAGVGTDPLVDGASVVLSSTQSSFAASGNTVSWGGQSFSVTAENADQITATASIGTNLYGEINSLTVTAGSVSNALSIAMQPTSGQRYFDLSGGLNSTATIRFEAVPDLTSNAQIHVSALRDATSTPVSTTLLEILADGTPSLARSVSLPAQIDARANNRDGQGWGAQETITVGLSYLTVMDEAGLGEAAAVSDLQSIGFSVRIVRISSLTVAQGIVISQQPAPGSQVPLGTEVALTVSLGAGNAPTNLSGFPLSAGSVRLTWTAPT